MLKINCWLTNSAHSTRGCPNESHTLWPVKSLRIEKAKVSASSIAYLLHCRPLGKVGPDGSLRVGTRTKRVPPYRFRTGWTCYKIISTISVVVRRVSAR